MSRPKEKNARVNPVIITRIRTFCFGNLVGYYERYLFGHVNFDFSRFRAMMRDDSCTDAEEATLYLRLAAVERDIQAAFSKYDLVDSGQVQWAVDVLDLRNKSNV